jgi:hypothetical protein
MKRKITLSFFLVISVITTFAQQKAFTPKTFKYGKIDPAEFETKVSGIDSAARGVKLFDVGRCWFEVSAKTGSFVYVYERHIRFKVINKTGYDIADFEIPIYHGSGGSEETLDYMDAATYNLENKQIVVSKLAKDAKFSEKHDKNWTIKKFTLANVKEGSVVEYKYRIKSDFIFNLRQWTFQSSLPTLYSEYDIRIPEYFKYKVSGNGYIPVNVVKREEINENYYIPSSGQERGGNVQAKALEIKYVAENVPAIKEESFITTLDDYISKIDFELTSTKFPNSLYKDYSSTWPNIVKMLIDEENFGRFVKKNGYAKATLPSIIKNETDPQIKTQLIFDYVKNSIKWNDRHGKYTSETNPKTIFEKKAGNSADINLSLLNLLTEAKISAAPVLVSTRENGAHPGHPLLEKFNNVIVQVLIGDKTYLLDATDKYLTGDLISYENLAHQGFKLNLDAEAPSGEWISLEQNTTSKNNTYYSLVLSEDNKLSGTLYLSFSNYAALTQRNKFSSAVNEAEFIKNYKKDKPGIEVKNFKIENLDNPSEFLTETMDVNIEDNVEEAGNLLLLSPLLFERTKENPFKQEERNYPVDFAYPLEENYRITIEFPKNYTLDKLPANGKVKLPNDEASFTYLFSTEGNKVAIVSKINISKSVFTAEEYGYLKELFKSIVEKQAQQLVFKKS